MTENTIKILCELLSEFERDDNNRMELQIRRANEREHPDDPKVKGFNEFMKVRGEMNKPFRFATYLRLHRNLTDKLEKSLQMPDEKELQKALEKELEKSLEKALKGIDKTIPITIKI